MSEEVKTMTEENEDFEAMLEESLSNMSTDGRVEGTVVGITSTEIQVDIGRKQTGYIKYDEYSSDPTVDPATDVKVGDTINCVIMTTNDAEAPSCRPRNVSTAPHLEEPLRGRPSSKNVCDINKGDVIAYRCFRRFCLPAATGANPSKSRTPCPLRKIILNRNAGGSIRGVLGKSARRPAEVLGDCGR